MRRQRPFVVSGKKGNGIPSQIKFRWMEGEPDWIAERLGSDRSSRPTDFPTYNEIASLSELRDSGQLANRLRQINWAFTSDDTLYLTHDIHPYPAKFIPQIPGNLIAQLSVRGELVLDPFGGSGTTALEAVRMGRRAVSIDANPIGTLIGQVKTTCVDKSVLVDLHALRSSLLTWYSNLPADPKQLTQEFSRYIPEIPNRDKWFPDTSCGELALIRSFIEKMESITAQNIALLALSRVVLKVSYQDSETRYASKPRDIPIGDTIRRFVNDFETILSRTIETAPDLRYGVVEFVTADARNLDPDKFPTESVDLIVTSPPYGNSNDYHLYHRFRLLWLGFDPRFLGQIEIGSHLRHQRESSGFDAYISEMTPCIEMMSRVLKPGRFAAMVVGDAVYKGKTYKGAEAMAEQAKAIGLNISCILQRPIHQTKRSFLAPARRASSEEILILQKPFQPSSITLKPPPYKLWNYEDKLRSREISKLLNSNPKKRHNEFEVLTDPYTANNARRLTFSHLILHRQGFSEKTWQAILENGLNHTRSSRKDPKYVTHGLHPYKGKFYPQLAKGLINIVGLPPGATVLDPFCGSGTTLLECYLNGLSAYGCDLHPLAAKIARAKIGILEVNPNLVSEAISTLLAKIDSTPSSLSLATDQFSKEAVDEIRSWFSEPVVAKLNWLLRAVRSVSGAVLRDFLEVILSSIIRDVSQQDPNDLRIRRRKEPLGDADVFGKFREQLDVQYQRVKRFWSIRGYCPYRFLGAKICEGDSRISDTFSRLGLEGSSVDLILTSPPYATALPYIDTDRLSLLIFFGMRSITRKPLEHHLTGSREITPNERQTLEKKIIDRGDAVLPNKILTFLSSFYAKVTKAEVGFRRKNLPALLLRFFSDMQQVLANCHRLLKSTGEAMIVIGDNTTTIDEGRTERIPTTDFIEEIGKGLGFDLVERIPIRVTTENLVHIRNAITKNIVLRFRR